MRFVLDLDDLDPSDLGRVAGRLTGDDGRTVRFEGWLDLARVLEAHTTRNRDHHQGAT